MRYYRTLGLSLPLTILSSEIAQPAATYFHLVAHVSLDGADCSTSAEALRVSVMTWLILK